MRVLYLEWLFVICLILRVIGDRLSCNTLFETVLLFQISSNIESIFEAGSFPPVETELLSCEELIYFMIALIIGVHHEHPMLLLERVAIVFLALDRASQVYS